MLDQIGHSRFNLCLGFVLGFFGLYIGASIFQFYLGPSGPLSSEIVWKPLFRRT